MKRFNFLFAPEVDGGGDAGAAAAPAAAAAGGQQQQEQAPVRPDYVPEKFWKEGKADFEGMGRSYAELERSFHSRQPAGVVVPAADAPPEAHAAYRKAIGVPDDANGYQLKPETLPEGVTVSEARLSKFAGKAHALGLSQAQARDLVAHVLEDEIESRTGAQTAYDNLMAEREKGLRDKWGVAYPQKVQVAKTVVAALGYDPKDPELFGNPKVLEFLGNVTGMLSEDAVASMRGAVGSSGTFSSPAEEARAITRDPKHPDHAAYMKGDQAIVSKVRRLYDSV